MSVTGILTSSFLNSTLQSLYGPQPIDQRRHQFRQDFQQLGQDLQSGNLSAAQADFAALQQLMPQSNSASPVFSSAAPVSSSASPSNSALPVPGSASPASSSSAGASASPTSSAQNNSPISSAQNNNPIAQDFKQLSSDLQSGNLSAAQQDYTKIQQDFQTALQSHGHHHHRHHRAGDSGGTQNSSNSIGQLFNQLGQALQSGDLSTAQQAYTSLQQDFQQFASNPEAQQPNPSGPNRLSLNA